LLDNGDHVVMQTDESLNKKPDLSDPGEKKTEPINKKNYQKNSLLR